VNTKTMTFAQAVCDAMIREMERDSTVYLVGEDVWGSGAGGALGVTGPVYQHFGSKRVWDTPISEAAIVGHAVGAAMAGLRPIAEIMFIDFIGCCFDEVMNQAAKMRYMTGGQAKVPLVIRTTDGAGQSAAAQHSQSLEALVAHVAGLQTVVPSTPADAKGLLSSAIRDDNPVVFIENKNLYAMEGEVPEGEYLIPIGQADVKREGSDVTIVTWSATVGKALEAAEALAQDGIQAEVLDLRTLVPMDKTALLRSLEKTHKLLVVHEAVHTCGFGAEVAAFVAEEGFDLLDAPIKRLTAPDTPVPFSPVLESAFVPDAANICDAVRAME
jgi:acetoin:2,6-dichlorophenolindophenol oxidoreductase subunit beta